MARTDKISPASGGETSPADRTPEEKSKVVTVQIAAEDIRQLLDSEPAAPVEEEEIDEVTLAKAIEVLEATDSWDALRDTARAVKGALEKRAWQDIDGWSAEYLNCMIDCGIGFIQWEEPGDQEPQIEKMRGILLQLVEMLGIEITEDPAAEAAAAEEVLATAGLDEVEFYSVPARLISELRTQEDFELRYGKIGEREVRNVQLVDTEVRESGAGGGQMTVAGYAAVYNKRSLDLGFFTEYIMPGAFDDVLSRSPDVHLLWDHDTRYVLARTKNESLDLKSQELGLRYWARVAPTTYGADLVLLLERGDIDQASFAFTVEDDTWTEEDGGTLVRRINKVRELFDVTITARGAYPQTTSEVIRGYLRSVAHARNETIPAEVLVPDVKRSNRELAAARRRVKLHQLGLQQP